MVYITQSIELNGKKNIHVDVNKCGNASSQSVKGVHWELNMNTTDFMFFTFH